MTKLPNDVAIYVGVDSESGIAYEIEWDLPVPIHKRPKQSERWDD